MGEHLKEHYDYCIINLRNNEVILYDQDKSCNVSPLSDEAILQVNVSFDEHNNLVIEGERLVYELAMGRVNIDELSRAPCKKFIQKYELSKFFRFFGAKPYEYVHGWWAYRSETPTKYILNNYRIKII